MFRLAAAIAAIALPFTALAQSPPSAAATPAELAVPGTCYVHALRKSDAKRLIDRIELQEVQYSTPDGRAVDGLRFHLGIQPKGGDDLIPSDVSLPCLTQGKTLVCTLQCDGPGTKPNGRFRVEPTGKTGRKVTFETEITLSACAMGEQATRLPKQLAGKSYVLARAGASDCFH